MSKPKGSKENKLTIIQSALLKSPVDDDCERNL